MESIERCIRLCEFTTGRTQIGQGSARADQQPLRDLRRAHVLSEHTLKTEVSAPLSGNRNAVSERRNRFALATFPGLRRTLGRDYPMGRKSLWL